MQYITLFASAFPLGAAVTFVFLYIEVRSDLFKLLTAYRRPLPMRQVSITTIKLDNLRRLDSLRIANRAIHLQIPGTNLRIRIRVHHHP